MFKLPWLGFAAVLVPTMAFGEELPAKEGCISIQKEGKYLVLTPEGKQLSEFTSKPERTTKLGKKEFKIADKYVVLMPTGKLIEVPYPEKKTLQDPCFSPDGKAIAFVAADYPRGLDRDFNYLRSLFVWNLEGKGEGFALDLKAKNLFWTPDGRLVVVETVSQRDYTSGRFTTWLVDLGTKKQTRLEMPDGAQLLAIEPDGKHFIAMQRDKEFMAKIREKGAQPAEVRKQVQNWDSFARISRDGKQVETIVEYGFGRFFAPDNRFDPRLSPDGKQMLFLNTDKDEKLAKGTRRWPRLYRYDLTTQKVEKVPEIPLDAFIMEYAWSPDSHKVAYIWKRMEPGAPVAANLGNLNDPKLRTETETHLNVSDADGKNPKTILTVKSPNSVSLPLQHLAWR